MNVLQPIVCSRQVVRPVRDMKQSPAASRLAGRIIQVGLALYLLPALMVVLAVGGLGMLILAGGRLLYAPIEALSD